MSLAALNLCRWAVIGLLSAAVQHTAGWALAILVFFGFLAVDLFATIEEITYGGKQ